MGGKNMKKRVSGSRKTTRNSLYRIALNPRKGAKCQCLSFFTSLLFVWSKPQTHLPTKVQSVGYRHSGFEPFSIPHEWPLPKHFGRSTSAWIVRTRLPCALPACDGRPAIPL